MLLIFKKNYHVTCICIYTGMQNTLSVSQAAKINWFSNVIGLPFIMLVTANNKDTMGNHEGGSKTRSLGQIIEKNLVYTLEGSVLIQSSLNFVIMLISIKKLGHVRSKIF